MIALALALLIQHEPLPRYADAKRCAALTIAHRRTFADDDPAAFDVSLFWSLVVGERAKKDRVPHARFERELADATESAARQLAARDATAQAALAACVARVPR